MISPHDATDNESQSDEKKEMLNAKCQEISMNDGAIKVIEELEAEGRITGGGKWVFGKRTSKVEEKQSCDESTHDEEKS